MEEIKVVKNSINKKELIDIAEKQFGDIIKAVVDIEQGILTVIFFIMLIAVGIKNKMGTW